MFRVDISECAPCGGRLHLVQVASEPAQIAKVLHAHVARGPPPKLLGQIELDFAGVAGAASCGAAGWPHEPQPVVADRHPSRNHRRCRGLSIAHDVRPLPAHGQGVRGSLRLPPQAITGQSRAIELGFDRQAV